MRPSFSPLVPTSSRLDTAEPASTRPIRIGTAGPDHDREPPSEASYLPGSVVTMSDYEKTHATQAEVVRPKKRGHCAKFWWAYLIALIVVVVVVVPVM